MFELHEKLNLQESDTRRQDASKAALGDELDGDTVCVEVGAAQGKLICAIGLAVGTDVDALDGDTVCVEVGAALGKLVIALDGDTINNKSDHRTDQLDQRRFDLHAVRVSVEAALSKLVCYCTSEGQVSPMLDDCKR